MRILLITPPFCQLNTPYPGTAFLKAWLKKRGHQVLQADTGLETYLRLFSRRGLEEYVFAPQRTETFQKVLQRDDSAKRIWQLRERYCEAADPVISYLQGRDTTLATLLCRPGFLPEGDRFATGEDPDSYGALGISDRARLRATLFLEDLGEFYRITRDNDFGFSRYADHLAMSPPSFDDLYGRALDRSSRVSRIHCEILREKIEDFSPHMAGFSVPFPGNLLEALRGASFIREKDPSIHLTMGGGFVNTELRNISDIRLSEFFDSVTLDDGEDALEFLCASLEGKAEKERLRRTWLPVNGKWSFFNDGTGKSPRHRDKPAPDYSDLPLNSYLSLVDRENPMHRLWSEGPWIKMMLAHGCYWKRCAFCDTSLDYICRYDPGTAPGLVDQIEELIGSTGKRSFHFVDEAAPPTLLKELALELIRRGCGISWWTNIRFEKNFSPQLCRLLARSGCIAVSGGLEVASDRLLKRIDKGVTVSQAGRVAASFREAGIMVHAYLMYGFPGQRSQELMDSLDVVRQLFREDLIQSAYWHHFALTAHSPVGLNPEEFGVRITGPEEGGFARNDLSYTQDSEDLSPYGRGLNTALYNYMRGKGFDMPLKNWFSFKVEQPRVKRNMISRIREAGRELELKDSSRLIWCDTLPEESDTGLIFRASDYQEHLELPPGESDFILRLLSRSLPEAPPFTLEDFDTLASHCGIDGDSWLSGDKFRELVDYGLMVL